jgi:hypothetical protein
MAGESLVNVKADTIEEFADKALKAIGGDAGEIGDTTYVITPDVTYDDDKVKKISLDIDISIRRAHWSGGKADARHKKAIETAENLNKDHEQKHRKIAQDIFTKMTKNLQKELAGKTAKEVDKKIAAIKAAIDKAFNDLDKKEGAVWYDDDENKGPITVKLTGV